MFTLLQQAVTPIDRNGLPSNGRYKAPNLLSTEKMHKSDVPRLNN